MIRKIKRINALQLGKMLGVLYGLLSLIFVPFFVLFAVLSSSYGHKTPTMMPGISGQSIAPIVQSNPMAMAPLLVMAVLFPIAYAVMGFIGGIIGAWIYNIVAAWVGGIEVEVE